MTKMPTPIARVMNALRLANNAKRKTVRLSADDLMKVMAEMELIERSCEAMASRLDTTREQCARVAEACEPRRYPNQEWVKAQTVIADAIRSGVKSGL